MFLVISTLPKGLAEAQEIATALGASGAQTRFIETDGMKISHCIGCNDCWIKTPGLCCIQDDYEQILIQMLQADAVILVAGTSLGFVSSQTKRLIDRILPMATMHLMFKDGQMRHYSRYDRSPDMALVYQGEAERDYLNLWLQRVQINFHGNSIGAFPIAQREELYHALARH